MASDKENKDKTKNKDKKHKNKDKYKNKSKKSSGPESVTVDTEDKKDTLEVDTIIYEVSETIEAIEPIEPPRHKGNPESIVSSISTGGTYPTYFFTQSNTLPPLDIPPDLETTILTLPAFTTQANQRVKLDAFFQLIVGSVISAPSFGYNLNIQLYRNSSSILSIDVSANEYSKPVSVGVYRELPILTWTDIPPTTGMQKYEIRVRRITFGNENNIDSVAVFSRALNAMVFT